MGSQSSSHLLSAMQVLLATAIVLLATSASGQSIGQCEDCEQRASRINYGWLQSPSELLEVEARIIEEVCPNLVDDVPFCVSLTLRWWQAMWRSLVIDLLFHYSIPCEVFQELNVLHADTLVEPVVE